MKIILDDIKYRGKHFDRVEFHLPDHLTKMKSKDLPEAEITEYVTKELDKLIDSNID